MKTPSQKTVREVGYVVEYSYAGFDYRLTKRKDGWYATPLPNQHHSANKDKHRCATIESYLPEYNEE